MLERPSVNILVPQDRFAMTLLMLNVVITALLMMGGRLEEELSISTLDLMLRQETFLSDF